MSVKRMFNRMKYIDYLIKQRATGNLESFARKNRLSKRGLTNVLAEMKEIGFPIRFSKSLNSYYYTNNGEMVKCLFKDSKSEITVDELQQISVEARNLCYSSVHIFEICDLDENNFKKHL